MSKSPILYRYGKYPPGYFDLRGILGPVVAYLFAVRTDLFVDAPFHERLGRINSLIIELIDDDELGLTGATPEQRVAMAEGIQ